jgi:hypothetical protein
VDNEKRISKVWIWRLIKISFIGIIGVSFLPDFLEIGKNKVTSHKIQDRIAEENWILENINCISKPRSRAFQCGTTFNENSNPLNSTTFKAIYLVDDDPITQLRTLDFLKGDFYNKDDCFWIEGLFLNYESDELRMNFHLPDGIKLFYESKPSRSEREGLHDFKILIDEKEKRICIFSGYKYG